MDAKQPQCSSLSRTKKKKVVCMVSLRLLEDREEYVLYVIDFNSPSGSGSSSNRRRDNDGFISRCPIFIIDLECSGDMSFCTFRSKIFIFQGVKFSKGAPSPIDQEPKPVYCIDVSPSDLTRFNINLKKKNLVEAGKMLHPKTVPMAILTPDKTKILVFSCYVRKFPADNIDFELYDPVNGTWSSLPPICERPLWVESYGFISETMLFIKTDIGTFSLAFQSPGEVWNRRQFNISSLEDVICDGLFYTIKDEFCLTPMGYFNFSRNTSYISCHDHPLSSAYNNGGCWIARDITLVDNGIGRDFVVLQISEPEDVEVRLPRLILDVCRAELTEYRKDKNKSLV